MDEKKLDAIPAEVAKELSKRNEKFRPIYDGITYVDGDVQDAKINNNRKELKQSLENER